MTTRFKVGDRVRFNDVNARYTSVRQDVVIIKRLDYEDDGTEYIIFDYKNSEWGGYFSYRFELVEPATPLDKQAAVIAKIKYLDKRYHDRRNLAA